MKLIVKNGKVTLSSLTVDEANTIINIVTTAEERCFKNASYDTRQENGDWYSGGDFVCVLSEKQQEALTNFCKSLNDQLVKLNSRSQ